MGQIGYRSKYFDRGAVAARRRLYPRQRSPKWRSHQHAEHTHRWPGRHLRSGPNAQQHSSTERGRGPGIRGSNQQLCRGVWPGRRRRVQRHHALRHQPVSRQRVRLFRERSAERSYILHAPVGQVAARTTTASRWAVRCGSPRSTTAATRRFFFFSFENLPQSTLNTTTFNTVPTVGYRNGDFSGAIAAAGNRTSGTDPLGRAIIQNTIYDPNTQRTVVVNGVSSVIRDPFPTTQSPVTASIP